MGKGSRNRALKQQNPAESAKNKQQKQAPQWVLPLVILLLVVAILAVPITMAITGTGIIERNRILIKSQTGKYNLSQSMATYMAWQILLEYSNASWESVKSEKVSGTTYTFQQYYQNQYGSDADLATFFAIDNAGAMVQSDLRGNIEPYMTEYMAYVAVCDAAHRANVSLTDEERATVTTAINELKAIYPKMGYSSFNKFLGAKVFNGIKENDIRAALEMKVLYDKYKGQMQKGYESEITNTVILEFRDAHPEKYYKIDYLTAQVSTKELAEKLLTAKNDKDFKEIIIGEHFEANYSETFATYLSQTEYKAIKGVTNSANGNALTEALDTIGFPAMQTYAQSDVTDESLKKWLFTSGSVGTATQISTGSGIYIAALIAKNTEANTVDARVKFYSFSEDYSSYNGNVAYREAVRDLLFAEKYAEMLAAELRATDADIDSILLANKATEVVGVTRDSSELPTAVYNQVFEMGNKAGSICDGFGNGIYYVIYIRSCESTGTGENFRVNQADIAYCAFGAGVDGYLSGSEKQKELIDKLEAAETGKEAIIREYDPIEKTDIHSKTSSSIVPTAVTAAVFKDITTLNIGDIFTANANGVYYVIYVTALANDGAKASILYKEFESDLFYKVGNSLIAGLDENTVYPAVKSTASYTPNADANTFLAWISEVQAGTLVSARNEFDTNMFEGKDKDGNTVYNAYIVLGDRMYLDSYKVVNGGYLRVTDGDTKGDFLERTNEIEAKLLEAKANGTAGTDLTALLKKLGASAQIDTDFSESAIPNEDLKAWMFDEARQANDIKVFPVKNSSFSYIGIYLSSVQSWEAKAKNDYISTKTEDWIASLTASYTVNESALNKIGDPTTVTTTAATTAATTKAQ